MYVHTIMLQYATYTKMDAMKNLTALVLVSLFLSLSLVSANVKVTAGTDDGTEQWGYVEVRPEAHLFWWLYKSPNRVEDPSNPWPTLLWLQGGPGASGVGFGNFLEIGPLDGNLEPRNSTWLRKADLLFVDSPVGTGFSYVDNVTLAVKTDEEAAADLTTLLKELFNANETLQKSPLYIFAESYGGKFAVTLGLATLEAIEKGELKLQLGGIALGNSLISPEDFVFSWGPLLKDMSRIDEIGLNQSNSLALKIQQQLVDGHYLDAILSWEDLEDVITGASNHVDFYNFMLDFHNEPLASTTKGSNLLSIERYSTYLRTKFRSATNPTSLDLPDLMNGPIRNKLKIIPANVTWGGQRGLVFLALEGDFMKPRIAEVDELLAKGVNVTIYNGQLDLICATKGVEAWMKKLKWDGLENFLSSYRTPLYCGEDESATKGFFSSYENLAFYWILDAGHFVPASQPCVSLQMLGSVTHSPSASH